VDWIILAHGMVQWLALVNTVKKNAGNFIRWTTITFSERSVLHVTLVLKKWETCVVLHPSIPFQYCSRYTVHSSASGQRMNSAASASSGSSSASCRQHSTMLCEGKTCLLRSAIFVGLTSVVTTIIYLTPIPGEYTHWFCYIQAVFRGAEIRGSNHLLSGNFWGHFARALGYGLDDSRRTLGIFLFTTVPRTALGPI
jgi:hypothetical protein